MGYNRDYHTLQSLLDSGGDERLSFDNVHLRQIHMASQATEVLPGGASQSCVSHGLRFDATAGSASAAHFQPSDGSLQLPDCDVESNVRFRCPVLSPAAGRADGLIILLHGLNEKRWEKYLPWAKRLVELTGKAVLLFPIAFHMTRTPMAWSDARRMARVSAERRAAFPTIAESSLANAAISTRISQMPQRFFWSGLQSYEDVLAVIRLARGGGIAEVSADARVDFFAYSIGAFLSEILLMAAEESVLASSRLFLFCGGPTLDRMYPTSRYILDSEATIAMYALFNEHLEAEFRRDPRLAHYFGGSHPAGVWFRSMLTHNVLRERREQRFREMAPRLRAVALLRDTVIPPGEVLNTLQGSFRDIPVEVDVVDFAHPYTHVQPFPQTSTHEAEVEVAFEQVMEAAARHFT